VPYNHLGASGDLMTPKVGGIVLCGGESRRMGRPKAWLPFGNEVLLQRVVRILGQVVDPIVVVAAPGQELPPLAAPVAIVHDAQKGRGPLEGLAAGLERLATSGVDAAFVSSTDAPFLQPALVRLVIDCLGGHLAAVPFADGRHQPLAAAYRTAALPAIQRLLGQGRLRPVFLFDEVATRLIDEAELRTVDPDLGSLRNLNTPADYTAALRAAELIAAASESGVWRRTRE